MKTLQVVVNYEWTAPPVMQLHSADVLRVDFDQLSHDNHRYVCRLEHCNPDFTPTEGLFESDWLEGFNDVVIDEYETSLNTTVPYTHYHYELPNEQQRLRLSGNYRLHVIDDDSGEEVLVACFRVAEQLMNLGLGVTTNTDVDHNRRYQQLSMTLNYNSLRVTDAQRQVQTVVMQNQRDDAERCNVRPTFVTAQGLRWEHCRDLIFEGGNEYRKFEALDVSHPTMGLEHMVWDEEQRRYHAYPFVCEPRRHYAYDEDADGAFYVRNSDNVENDRVSDYVWVHYKLAPAPLYDNARLMVCGLWATEQPSAYAMSYDPADGSYNACIMQKQGYYNYQFVMRDAAGESHQVPEEGSFYQTENSYQAYAYYRADGARYWRLAAWQQHTFKAR